MFQTGRLPKGPVMKAVTVAAEDSACRSNLRVKPERARMINRTSLRSLQFSLGVFVIVKGCDSRGPKVGQHKKTCCPAFQWNSMLRTVSIVISPGKACSSAEWPSRLPAPKPGVTFRVARFRQSRTQNRYNRPEIAKATAIQTL